MKKTIYIASLLLLGGLSSCYKDHSVGVTHELSTLAIAEGSAELDASYTGRFGAPFVLSAPEVSQSHETQALTYRWEIYRPNINETSDPLPTVQTEKELRFTPDTYGTYNVNLRISNDDNSYFQSFQIVIPNSYNAGLYALLSKDDRPEIAYIPAAGYDSASDAETYEEGLNLNNPVSTDFAGFEAAPSSINAYDQYRRPYISLTLVNGKNYLLNANTMQTLTLDPSTAEAGEAKIIAQRGSQFQGIVRNGQFYVFLSSSNIYARNARGQYEVTRLYPGTRFSDQGAIVRSQIGEAAFLFDEGLHTLYLMRTANFFRYEATSSTLGSTSNSAKWNASTLTAMTSYDSAEKVALLLRSSSDASTFYLATFELDANVSQAAPIHFLKLDDVPAALGLTASSRMASHNDLLYLSSGNKVYTHIASSTSYESTPLITLPEADMEIVQLLTRNVGENTYLYVAATNGTTSSIYYYDVTNGTRGTQVWAKTGITGKLLQLTYRAS